VLHDVTPQIVAPFQLLSRVPVGVETLDPLEIPPFAWHFLSPETENHTQA
jgi:hypothetical protein